MTFGTVHAGNLFQNRTHLMPDGQLIQPAIRPDGSVSGSRGFARVAAAFLAFIAFSLAPGSFAQNYPAVSPTPDSAPAPATTPAPAPAPESLSSNRFLFVVDTSAPMHSHLHDIIGVEESILRSSASGQLHDGDTIGVWTFNEDVHTGTMPLQVWSSDDAEEIALRVAEFIRQQDFGKKSRLDLAMVPVAKVVKMSDIITIFVISSGTGPIRGTPYDDDINNQYLQCLRDMGKKPMPIVTVLQGKRGKFIRYTVNALPWPVVIPELPIALKITDESPAVTTAAPAVTPKAADQSIAASAAPTPPPPVQSQLQPVATAPSAAQPQPPPPPSPFGTSSPPPPPVPMAQPQSPPPVVPVVVATAPPPAPPAMPAPVPAPVAPVIASETPAPAAPVTPPAPPAVEARPATSAVLPIVPPRPPPLVQKTLPATGVLTQDTAPAAPVPEAAPAPAAPAPVVTAAPAQTAPAAPVPAPSKTLVAQATALIKSFTGNHRSLLLIGGVSLLVVATGLILLMARRSRSPGRVSLISQTMNDRRP
jgi:hypothetical protein